MSKKPKFNEAVKLKKDYQKLRKKHKEKTEFNFIKKLDALGYTEEELYLDEMEDLVKGKHFIIKEITSNLILSEIILAEAGILQNGKSTALLGRTNTTTVLNATTGQQTYNSAFCAKHHEFYVIPINAPGDTLVPSSTDLPVAIITDDYKIMGYINKRVDNWIKENFSNIRINECMRGTIHRVGNIFTIYYVFYFNLDPYTSDICDTNSMICGTGLKGLSNYGTPTRDDLINKMKEWLP